MSVCNIYAVSALYLILMFLSSLDIVQFLFSNHYRRTTVRKGKISLVNLI